MGRRPTKSPKVVNKAKPTCGEMIEAAITNMSEKFGSSKSDILKYMKANWNVDASMEKAMEAELRKAVKDGNIVQTTKGKSKTRLFKINKSNTTPKLKSVENVAKNTKCEALKKRNSEDNKEGEASKPDIKSETMTRAKLPVKVKEAKEKKKADAAAKRESAKKRKKGKRRKKGAKGNGNSRAAEIRAAAKRGIPKKILDAFEEIWKNM